MITSTAEIRFVRARDVAVTGDGLSVDLADGRTITVPLAWYPRLAHATPVERRNWRFIGDAQGIHWPDLDEDISVEGLLAGRPSGESQNSFAKWLGNRKEHKARAASRRR